MVRTSIDGFQVPFPTLVEFLIFMGYKGVNLSLRTIGSMCGENFLQELSLHFCSVPNGPWPQRVKPNLGLILLSQRKKFQPHQIHIGSILLEGIAYFLKVPDMRIWVITLHTMEGGK